MVVRDRVDKLRETLSNSRLVLERSKIDVDTTHTSTRIFFAKHETADRLAGLHCDVAEKRRALVRLTADIRESLSGPSHHSARKEVEAGEEEAPAKMRARDTPQGGSR